MRVQITHNRIGILAFCLLAGFVLVALRLFHLQLFMRSELLTKAINQQFYHTQVPARRGAITDRNGTPLAESQVTESIFLNIRQVKHPALVARKISEALKMSSRGLLAKMRGHKSFWVKRNARMEDAALLKKARLNCLSFFPETKRYYPLNGLGSHVLGFTDIDGRGLEGVEKQYDEDLKGRPGLMRASRDARGHAVLSDCTLEKEAVDGADLTLTLDAQLQYIAERELDKAFRKFRPRRASLVVMDPYSGEILALANRPAFNCNRPMAATAFELRNTAISDTFEPGSTFKVVTASLALEEGVVTPETPIDCKYGRARILGRIVKDHEGTQGVVSFEEVIAQSSNVGAVTVALKVGKNRFYEGARRFGFGIRTGVDLPGEAPGVLRPVAEWSKISMAALPYGQELSCNLLHVACLYAPFANNGRTVVPHVVKEIRPRFGWTREARLTRQGGEKVVGSRVRQQVKDMLKAVVDHGTGTPAGLPDFSVAGKTGTSEKYDVRRKAYVFDKNCSTFVGFVPADHPRFLMAVMLDEPHGMTLGGWVAGPVFREVASAGRTAWKVAPDSTDGRAAQNGAETSKPDLKAAPALVTVPDLTGMKAARVKSRLKALGLKPRPKGSKGFVVSQFPSAGRAVRKATYVSYLLKQAPPQKKQARGTGVRGVELAKGE